MTRTDYDLFAVKIILEAFSLWIILYLVFFLALPLWFFSLQFARAMKKKIPKPPSGGFREGLFLFAYSFLLCWAVAIFIGLFTLDEEEAKPSLTFNLIRTSLTQGAVYLTALLIIAKYQGRQGLARAGFRLENSWRTLLFGLGAYFAFYPVYVLAIYLNAQILTPEPQEIVKELMENPELYGSLVIMLSASIIIPLLEEILFRGFLLSGLRAFMGPLPAILISAAVFGYLHDPPARLPVFVLGCILGYLKDRTGSLAPAVFVHALHNSIMLAFIPFVGN